MLRNEKPHVETGGMTVSPVTVWDNGRLTVHRNHVSVLEASGLTTVKAFMDYEGGEAVKRAVIDRQTDRIHLEDYGAGFVGFLKRHRRPRWSE
jgi:hypothetical protein